MTKYQVKCPQCGRLQIMETKDPGKARRQCVFCGKSFKVTNAIIKE